MRRLRYAEQVRKEDDQGTDVLARFVAQTATDTLAAKSWPGVPSDCLRAGEGR